MAAIESSLKKVAQTALAAMAVLFILGMIFYKERSLFADAAYRLFNVINYSRFDIPGNRYGAFVVQVLPYIARKMHLSVNAILFCYGSSYYLFYLLVTVIIAYRYKQYSLAIIMALFYFLFSSESFIWVSETFLGSAWMFLLFAVILRWGNKQGNIFLLLIPFSVLAFLSIFSHFVLIIPMVFLWIYFVLEKKNRAFSKKNAIFLGCILIIIISLKFMDTRGDYDSGHLHGITHFSLKDIICVFQAQVVKTFLYRCIINYWLGILVFVTGIVSLVKSKEKMLALWTFISVLGYIIIMALTYGDLDRNTLLFHIESEWSCIGIIVATPFVFNFLPKIKTPVTMGLLAGIFIIRLIYIVSFLPPFTERNNITEQLLKQMRKKNITKLALYNDARLLSATKLSWALPFESIMMSSMDGDKQKLTFLFVNPDDKQTIEELRNAKNFYYAWMVLPGKDLDKEYFSIDTTKTYQIMTYEAFLK